VTGATLIVTTHDNAVVERLRLRPLVHEIASGADGQIVSTFRE
jgi:hypothetical protein